MNKLEELESCEVCDEGIVEIPINSGFYYDCACIEELKDLIINHLNTLSHDKLIDRLLENS